MPRPELQRIPRVAGDADGDARRHQNKISPGEPLDRDIYEMTREEMKNMGIRTTPGSLEEALSALEQDHAFLLRGDVFTEDLVQTWITYKRQKELDPIRLRPHPHEFYLYYDN